MWLRQISDFSNKFAMFQIPASMRSTRTGKAHSKPIIETLPHPITPENNQGLQTLHCQTYNYKREEDLLLNIEARPENSITGKMDDRSPSKPKFTIRINGGPSSWMNPKPDRESIQSRTLKEHKGRETETLSTKGYSPTTKSTEDYQQFSPALQTSWNVRAIQEKLMQELHSPLFLCKTRLYFWIIKATYIHYEFKGLIK
ncbi:LOW QUALITY PROTEIN: hypothetical protein NC652_034990 [Populus alba x Populus x berolinensis]|nr:LOW QUALITY PROTEIN: hypothetical protein NC652_034990 [Populus alba x Populus x berolinensis]